MRVGVQTLAALDRLARDGAREAAACLTGLTGVETVVEVAKISFVPASDAWRRSDAVGVRIGLSGALDGETVLAFDPGSAEALGELLGADATSEESVVREVGNILTSGFVDGWADHLGATIDITPPTFVEGPVEALADEHVVGFASRIETVDGDVSFRFFLVPEPDSFQAALDEHEPDRDEHDRDRDAEIHVEKLSSFAELTRHGAATVSESLSSMTDIETAVEITEFSFVPVETTPRAVDDGPAVGVVTEFSGPPGGYLVILFTESSARRLVEALVPDADPDAPFEGLGRSAIREIGNVTATSFLDGWANVLETTIDVTPPRFVHDLGGAIVDPVVVRLGASQAYAFACDATVEADDEGFDCTIYALPDEEEFADALAALDVERVTDGSAERI